MQRYATTAELAARYRVTPETIRAWARQGKIPSARVGRRPLLFDVGEVDRCMRQGEACDDSQPKHTTHVADST